MTKLLFIAIFLFGIEGYSQSYNHKTLYVITSDKHSSSSIRRRVYNSGSYSYNGPVSKTYRPKQYEVCPPVYNENVTVTQEVIPVTVKKTVTKTVYMSERGHKFIYCTTRDGYVYKQYVD